MSRAEAYRRAHNLMYRPEDVFVWDAFVHANYWATDRYGFINLGAAGIRDAWPDGDISARWKLTTTKAAQRIGATGNMDVPDRMLLRLAALPVWTPLTVTEWAIAYRGVHQRVLVREADQRPVTMNSEWLDRWEATFPKGLLIEQNLDAQPGETSERSALRVSTYSMYRSADDFTEKRSATVVGYVMPSKVPMSKPPELVLSETSGSVA